MSTAWGKAGRFTAKALGIKLQDKDPYDEVTRGESIISNHTTGTFVEEPPRTVEFLQELFPSRKQWADYAISLFPFLSWIGHYNLQWLIGDLVAGKMIQPSSLCSSNFSIAYSSPRYYYWCHCHSTGHGLRPACQP